jgi:hypothetical protein
MRNRAAEVGGAAAKDLRRRSFPSQWRLEPGETGIFQIRKLRLAISAVDKPNNFNLLPGKFP